MGTRKGYSVQRHDCQADSRATAEGEIPREDLTETLIYLVLLGCCYGTVFKKFKSRNNFIYEMSLSR